MSIFTRFTDIVHANLNSLLDKAEDPEKMIKYIIQEMDEALIEVRTSAVKYLAEQTQLQRFIKENEIGIANWQQKAQLAVEKNCEDLAKLALLEKQKLLKKNESLAAELTEIKLVINNIQADSQRLQDKITEAKSRQQSLLLRKDSASVQLKLRAHISNDKVTKTILKFEHYERKVEHIEAQVQAYDLLHPQDLNSQIQALVDEDFIHNELELLKAQKAS